MEWLIPLLMFAFPVVIALLDKQAKKRKNVPPAMSGSGARSGKRPAAQDPSQPSGWAPPSYGAEGGYGFPDRLPKPADTSQAATVSRTEDVFRGKPPGRVPEAASTEKSEEGQRAIAKERRKGAEQKKVNPEQKLEIDKKKLILYSEILKPKFDA